MKISRIILGGMSFGNGDAWMIRGEEGKKFIEKALDLGINMIDTADVYSDGGSEGLIGEAIKERRNDLIIATKVGLEFGNGINNKGLSRYRIMNQIKGSLERLGTDHVELYQMHRWDYGTPIEETLATLTDLVKENKVYYIGATSVFSFQIQRMIDLAEMKGYSRLASYSPRYNLVYREEEREGIPLCRELNLAIIPYSPLGRGFLGGRYKRGMAPDSQRYKHDKYFAGGYFKPEDFDVLEVLEEVAKEKGTVPSKMALAWLFSKPWITAPILGITDITHLTDAVESLELRLSQDDINRLEKPYKPHEMHGPTKSPLLQ